MTDARMSGSAAAPQVLVFSYTPTASEPRVLKQVSELAKFSDVTTAGFGPAPDAPSSHIELSAAAPYARSKLVTLLYLLGLAFRQYWLLERINARDKNALAVLSQRNWDVIVAHDVHTVAVAQKLNPKSGILVDLHEYAPRQYENSRKWRLLIAPYYRWIVRKRVTKVEAVTTVSQGIVEEYAKQFGIDAALVVNATPYSDLSPTAVGDPIRLVHSGIPGRARKLELMIDAVIATPANVTLDFYLMKDGSDYYRELVDRASVTDRIKFRDPVSYDRLVSTLNGYDVGVSILPPTTFNLAWCLPNKFFDFVQARLGIIIGPSPEMQRYVERNALGAVTRDFSVEAFLEVLEGLTAEQVAQWKANSNASAQEMSSAEQVKIWGKIVKTLLSA